MFFNSLPKSLSCTHSNWWEALEAAYLNRWLPKLLIIVRKWEVLISIMNCLRLSLNFVSCPMLDFNLFPRFLFSLNLISNCSMLTYLNLFSRLLFSFDLIPNFVLFVCLISVSITCILTCSVNCRLSVTTTWTQRAQILCSFIWLECFLDKWAFRFVVLIHVNKDRR